MLFVAQLFVYFLWSIGANPDSYAIPLLTATADLTGSSLLAALFNLLALIGGKDPNGYVLSFFWYFYHAISILVSSYHLLYHLQIGNILRARYNEQHIEYMLKRRNISSLKSSRQKCVKFPFETWVRIEIQIKLLLFLFFYWKCLKNDDLSCLFSRLKRTEHDDS